MNTDQAEDHWTKAAYSASASFVPALATTVTQWLDPQPTDLILDLGCGDGVLTAKVHDVGASVTGLDASPNLIEAARNAYGSDIKLTWIVHDCRYLENCQQLEKERFTKVFSNAALHWILRDPTTRISVLRNAYRVLQPGGSFVFEMGGAGNVAEVHAALLAAVVHQGVSVEAAREACPWFFPSETLMKQMLEEVGFEVEESEVEYRPTKLTAEEEGGLEGWVRLMGAQFLEKIKNDEKRELAVREVCQALESVITREEDTSMYLGYIRLRVLARKRTAVLGSVDD